MAYGQRAYAHAPCDSYFVENLDEDNGRHMYDRRSRDGAARADERLSLMADEMSRAVVEEYTEDILDHLTHMEAATLPDVDSIDIQTEIQWFMRPYLLDFLIEAHLAFQLLPETLFLAINLLDRYCSKRVVYKKHYQLVGCSALLIAAKYGDKKDRVPTIKELKSMCCALYDEDMFTQMEWHVLQTLGWLVGHPTPETFLEMLLLDVVPDAEVEYLSRYLCEIAMFHKEFVSTRPSVLARSCLAMARHMLNRSIPKQCDWALNYDITLIVVLSQYLERPSQVVFRKYSTPQTSSVSLILDDFIRRQNAFSRQTMTLVDESEFYAPQITLNSQGNLLANNANNMPATPHKDKKIKITHGLITPPETPNSGELQNANGPPQDNKQNHPGIYRPITPVLTPNSSFSSSQTYFHKAPTINPHTAFIS